MLAVLIGVVSALPSSDSRLKHWYKLDEPAGALEDSKVPNANFTLEMGSPTYRVSGFAPGSDYAIDFGTNGDITFESVGGTSINFSATQNRSHCYMFWVNLTDVTTGQYLFQSGSGTGGVHMHTEEDKDTIVYYLPQPPGIRWDMSSSDIVDGAVQLRGFCWNHTNIIFIVNGVKVDSTALDDDPGQPLVSPFQRYGGVGTGIEGTRGIVDDWAIFQKTDETPGDVFTDAELLDLYSSWIKEDSDGDGILDEDDLCPNTTDEEPNEPNIYGCSCRQILEIMPGNHRGELRNGCSKGTINVFTKLIGWARDLFE